MKGYMKTIDYFAYGSNMSTAQMRERCPDAVKICVATLPEYAFLINERGVAGVVEKQDALVIGVLWKISAKDKVTLDEWEGANRIGGAYYRKNILVITDIRSVDALVYLARNTTLGRPKEGYLEKIVSAARDHGIDHDYVCRLEACGTAYN